MCNHYQSHPEAIQTWAEYIGWSLPSEPFSEVQIDIWPKREGLIARIDADGAKVIEPVIWGVPLSLPGKRPGTTVTKHVTNVRNLSSPFWRSMLVEPEGRCLVPFTRFAEPKIGAGREEHWFTIKNRPVSAFAGVWRWADGAAKEGEAAKVFAFLTCEPNPLVAPLHPKAMPVILQETDYQAWLTAQWEEAKALVTPYPSQLMSVE